MMLSLHKQQKKKQQQQQQNMLCVLIRSTPTRRFKCVHTTYVFIENKENYYVDIPLAGAMNKSIGYLYTQVPQLNAVKTGVWRITMFIIREILKSL